MNIPNFVNEKVVDENGYFTPGWRFIFMQLFKELKKSFSDNGFLLPSKTDNEIVDLWNKKLIEDGSILYDNVRKLYILQQNGILKVIQTTDFPPLKSNVANEKI